LEGLRSALRRPYRYRLPLHHHCSQTKVVAFTRGQVGFFAESLVIKCNSFSSQIPEMTQVALGYIMVNSEGGTMVPYAPSTLRLFVLVGQRHSAYLRRLTQDRQALEVRDNLSTAVCGDDTTRQPWGSRSRVGWMGAEGWQTLFPGRRRVPPGRRAGGALHAPADLHLPHREPETARAARGDGRAASALRLGLAGTGGLGAQDNGNE